MSATGRPKKEGPRTVREVDDAYETPSWAVRAIWPHVAPIIGSVLDPCAGRGAIFRALEGHYPKERMFGVEINQERAAEAKYHAHVVHCADFLNPPEANQDPSWLWAPRLIFTNPPYKLALEFIQRSLELTRTGEGEVCMLLRLNFLGSQKRGDWLKDHIPDVFVLSERPSFTGQGTDATEYCWMVWGRKRTGKLRILPAAPYGRDSADDQRRPDAQPVAPGPSSP